MLPRRGEIRKISDEESSRENENRRKKFRPSPAPEANVPSYTAAHQLGGMKRVFGAGESSSSKEVEPLDEEEKKQLQQFNQKFEEFKTLVSSIRSMVSDMSNIIQCYPLQKVLTNSLLRSDLDSWKSSLQSINIKGITDTRLKAEECLKNVKHIATHDQLQEISSISIVDKKTIRELEKKRNAIIFLIKFEERHYDPQISPASAYQSNVAEILRIYKSKPNQSWETPVLRAWSQTIVEAKTAYNKRLFISRELQEWLDTSTFTHMEVLPEEIVNNMEGQVNDIKRQLIGDPTRELALQEIIERCYYQKHQELCEKLKEMTPSDMDIMRQNIETRYYTRIRKMNILDSSIAHALAYVGISTENDHYYILESRPCVRNEQGTIVRQSSSDTYQNVYSPSSGIFLGYQHFRNIDMMREKEMREESPELFENGYPPPAHLDEIQFYHIQRATEQYKQDNKSLPKTFKPKLTMFIEWHVQNDTTVQMLKSHLAGNEVVTLEPGTIIHDAASALPLTEAKLRIVKQFWPYFSDIPLKLQDLQAEMGPRGLVQFMRQTVVPK